MHMAADGEVLGWVRLANDPETPVAVGFTIAELPHAHRGPLA